MTNLGHSQNSTAPSVGCNDAVSASGQEALSLSSMASGRYFIPDLLQPIAETVERQVLPRLMTAHGTGVGGKEPTQGLRRPNVAEVSEFAELCMWGNMHEGLRHVSQLLQTGVSMEALLLDVMTPAARELGERWVDDRSDLTEVTLGLSRMKQILRSLTPGFEAIHVSAGPTARRALFMTLPGEQHTLGVDICSAFLRRYGWDVLQCIPDSTAEVMETLSNEAFDIVGFSIVRDHQLQGLDAFIKEARQASRNKNLGVILGGRVISDQPDLATDLGANAVAVDGRDAVTKAQALLEEKPDRL